MMRYIVLWIISYTMLFPTIYEDATYAYNKKDFATALVLYTQLAEQGHKLAEHNLNKLYFKTNNYSLAYDWYIRHKGYNSPHFVYSLGVVFEMGKKIERDYTKARLLYEMASKRGSAKAWYRLGGLYEYNKGVEQNYEKAAYYYNNGAKGGYAQSQFAMGRLYYFGKGVKSNHEKAYKWMNIAKRQGNKDAKRFIIQHSLK